MVPDVIQSERFCDRFYEDVYLFTDAEFQDLYRYCLALAGEKDEAYDLLHTCYEKYMRLSTSHIERPFGYFRRMIRNQFLDKIRRQTKEAEIVESMTLVPMEEPTIEDLLVTREELSHLLSRLQPEERELLYMWSVEGYTTQELADHLEKPLGTVLSKLHRLKRKCQGPKSDRVGGAS